MFRSYAINCRFQFDHDGESACCAAQLVYYDRNMFVIRFSTDVNGPMTDPVAYAITNYRGKYWIANLNEETSVFIDDLIDAESNADCLLELDDMDDYEAEELSEVIRYFYSYWDKENSRNFQEEDEMFPYLEDDYLPF